MADEYRDVQALYPDPANRTMFDGMDEEELQGLTESIRRRGIIHAITVRPASADGRHCIIAGEQRWRAAQLAGLQLVPVSIRDVSDEEAEALRIDENIHRQTVKHTVRSRAIRRLYMLEGVTEDGPLMSQLPPPVSESVTLGNGPTPRQRVAQRTGYSEKQVGVLNTLADLIPALGILLDEGKISQKVAYQLAQLPAETSRRHAARWRDTTPRHRV